MARIKVNVTKELLSKGGDKAIVAAVKNAGFTGRVIVDGFGIMAAKKYQRTPVSLNPSTDKQYQQVIDTLNGVNTKPFNFTIKADNEVLVSAGYQAPVVDAVSQN